ncbi:unnamed protein product [Brassica oleracea]
MERMSQIISFPAGQIIDTHTPPRVFWFPFIQSFLEKERQKPRENLEENKPTKVHAYSFGVVLYEIIMGRSTIKPMEPSAENILLEWIKLYDVDSKSFRMIVDSSLRTVYIPQRVWPLKQFVRFRIFFVSHIPNEIFISILSMVFDLTYVKHYDTRRLQRKEMIANLASNNNSVYH